MKKIVFCNIAYMKNYVGITEDDAPNGGGTWVAENQDAHEKFNFLDYNGRCYGYCPLSGVNLDRIVGASYKEDKLEDVLVVWTATRKAINSRVIVGWYDHATIYRNWQETITYGIHPEYQIHPDTEKGFDLWYLVDALAKDCCLLPEDKRTFRIPKASKVGKGKGMGQSPIWYADSDYARNEFVPKVLKYISEYMQSNEENKYINFVVTKEYIEDAYHGEDGELSTEKLEELVNTSDDPLYYLNALLKIKQTPELLRTKAEILMLDFNRLDEAIAIYEDLDKADPKSADIRHPLFLLYCITKQHDKAIKMGQWLENENSYFHSLPKENQYGLLLVILKEFVNMKKASSAEIYLQKLRTLHLEDSEEDIEYLEDYIQNA